MNGIPLSVFLLLHSHSVPVCSVLAFSLRCGRQLLCPPYSQIHTPSSSAMKTPTLSWRPPLSTCSLDLGWISKLSCCAACSPHPLNMSPTNLSSSQIWSTSWWQLRPSSCLDLKSWLNPLILRLSAKVLQNTFTIWQPLPFDTATSLVRGTIISYLIWLSDLLPFHFPPCFLGSSQVRPPAVLNAGLILALGPLLFFPSSFCQKAFPPRLQGSFLKSPSLLTCHLLSDNYSDHLI